MSPQLALLAILALIFWLFAKDRAQRPTPSAALWLPTIWLAILGSKPLTYWFNVHSPTQNTDGSPLDRLVLAVVVISGVIVLAKRRVPVRLLISANPLLSVYFVYIALSVVWSDNPFASLKQWIKDVGNLIMVLIVLSERLPIDAIKTVLLRCGYLLIPLSWLLSKYYYSIGRSYDQSTGVPAVVGVTFDKNQLGATLFLCAVGLCWSFLDLRVLHFRDRRAITLGHLILTLMLGWLLLKANCATALFCTILASTLVWCMQQEPVRIKVMQFNVLLFMVVAITSVVLIQLFGIHTFLLETLGRDLTLTGRTEIWKRTLEVPINPFFGAGYSSFLTAERKDILSQGFTFPVREIHNGYLEMYVNCGLIGLSLLIGAVGASMAKVRRTLAFPGTYAAVQITFVFTIAIYSMTESFVGGFSPLWFVLLLLVIELPTASAKKRAPAIVGYEASVY
jgi:exopolysaccharide production protein ExoQ